MKPDVKHLDRNHRNIWVNLSTVKDYLCLDTRIFRLAVIAIEQSTQAAQNGAFAFAPTALRSGLQHPAG